MLLSEVRKKEIIDFIIKKGSRFNLKYSGYSRAKTTKHQYKSQYYYFDVRLRREIKRPFGGYHDVCLRISDHGWGTTTVERYLVRQNLNIGITDWEKAKMDIHRMLSTLNTKLINLERIA